METGLPFSRRDILGLLSASGVVLAGARRASAATQASFLGPAETFSFNSLIARAKRAAAAPYQAPSPRIAAQVSKLDYDAYWKIRFRDAASLLPAGADAPVQLFYPGKYFPEPVNVYLVDSGVAHEVLFNRDHFFSIPADSPARKLPADLGFAGFRVMRPGMNPDWVSFVGASYFRTDGPDRQYGLSARGIAIDTGMTRPEEFPRFTAFWLGPPEDPADDMTVWALLDGPSITGAYRFGLRRKRDGGGHRTSVAARLFLRKRVERLGIAPLTSMYWFSQFDRVLADDWRPEVHDSDGLALATGAGERIWRPLDNPERVTTTTYLDHNPRGFGLSQRDRNFDHYQDDGVFYNRRPSAWVEPLGKWGAGAVDLVEIPANDETMDNVVAYWMPKAKAEAGDALSFDYAINWVARDPAAAQVASVVATRQGRGGIPGQPIPKGVDKMVVDFAGPALDGLDAKSGVEPVVEAHGGSIVPPIGAWPVVGTKRWRLAFDFRMDGTQPVELRGFLRLNGRALTETWLARTSTDRAARRWREDGRK